MIQQKFEPNMYTWNTRIIRNVGMTGQRTYFTIEITRSFTLKKAKKYSNLFNKILMEEVKALRKQKEKSVKQ